MRYLSHFILVCWVCAGSAQAFASATSSDEAMPKARESAHSSHRIEHALMLMQRGIDFHHKGHIQKAIRVLEEARRLAPKQLKIRRVLSEVYISLGELYERSRLRRRSRWCYARALSINPHLVDDKKFFARYQQLQADKAARKQTIPYTKSRDMALSLGLTLGINGLLGVQFGMLFAGMFQPTLTFSPVLQTFDLSLQVILLRMFHWSPYVSAGVVVQTPLDRSEQGIKLSGPSYHVGGGIHYLSSWGFSFLTGLDIVYMTGDKKGFHWLPNIQLSWVF